MAIPPSSSLSIPYRASARGSTPRKQDLYTRHGVTDLSTQHGLEISDTVQFFRPSPSPCPTREDGEAEAGVGDEDDDEDSEGKGIAQAIIDAELGDGRARADWEDTGDYRPGYITQSIEADPSPDPEATRGSNLKNEVYPEDVPDRSSSSNPDSTTYTGTLLISARTYACWRNDLLASILRTHRGLLERCEAECPVLESASRAWEERNMRLYEDIWASLGKNVKNILRKSGYGPVKPAEGLAYDLWSELEGMFGPVKGGHGNGDSDEDEEGWDEEGWDEEESIFEQLEDLLWYNEQSEGWTGRQFRGVARQLEKRRGEIGRLFGRGSFLKGLVCPGRGLTAEEKLDIQALLDVCENLGEGPDESSLQPVRELRAALGSE